MEWTKQWGSKPSSWLRIYTEPVVSLTEVPRRAHCFWITIIGNKLEHIHYITYTRWNSNFLQWKSNVLGLLLKNLFALIQSKVHIMWHFSFSVLLSSSPDKFSTVSQNGTDWRIFSMLSTSWHSGKVVLFPIATASLRFVLTGFGGFRYVAKDPELKQIFATMSTTKYVLELMHSRLRLLFFFFDMQQRLPFPSPMLPFCFALQARWSFAGSLRERRSFHHHGEFCFGILLESLFINWLFPEIRSWREKWWRLSRKTLRVSHSTRAASCALCCKRKNHVWHHSLWRVSSKVSSQTSCPTSTFYTFTRHRFPSAGGRWRRKTMYSCRCLFFHKKMLLLLARFFVERWGTPRKLNTQNDSTNYQWAPAAVPRFPSLISNVLR